jgi:hypothetical protein
MSDMPELVGSLSASAGMMIVSDVGVVSIHGVDMPEDEPGCFVGA